MSLMRLKDLSGDRALLQDALIIFSAVSLGTLEFIKKAFPTEDFVQVPKTTVVFTIILVQVVPAILLFAADRAIATRDKSGRFIRAFRTGLFVVALLLILRQLQVYWEPAEDVTQAVRSASVFLLILAGLAVLAGVVWLCVKLLPSVVQFFYYMSPVAIAMTAIVPFQVPTAGTLPDAYGREVVTADHGESRPAVFILILDELSYDALVKDGDLDAQAFPNLASLAEDGAWFTNATSNYFWTRNSIPDTITDPIIPLAGQFDIRFYLQYPVVEDLYIDQCGKAFTCRSSRYLADNERSWMATNLGVRAFYQATPESLESVIKTPVGWFLGALDTAFPPADPSGWHTFSKKQFNVFLNDIEGEEAPGSIYVMHSLLTHWPYVFNENGKAVSSASAAAALGPDWQNPRKVAAYMDSLVGKLIDKLKNEGVYDNSVIAVTSDHGLKSFLPSPDKPPVHFQVQVPMLIRAPGLNGLVSDVDYQHIDFAPTLMDILGLPPSEDALGVSAFSEDRPQRDKVFHVEDFTFIYNSEDGSWSTVGDDYTAGRLPE
jgi:hypothetical protein